MSDQRVYKAGESLDNTELGALGRCLKANGAPEKVKMWRKVLFAVLGLLVLLNIVIPNHHPHFGVDRVPGFWPAFGFFVGVVMVFFVKKIVQPLIKRPEDYYGDI